MTTALSIPEARKLVLFSQGLPPARFSGSATDASLAAIERLNYIQIDTISVVERAHHHTLWNRNPRYQPGQLDELVERGKVFEYWSHAAAYLPMRDYRFSLPRKRALARGKHEHWFDRNAKMERLVLERIASEGPLMARDFEHSGTRKAGEWRPKPAKQALENLYMQGDLMCSRRINFQKVYDLTDRVLPPDTDTTEPGEEEYSRHLVTRYLQANGLGTSSEVAYLLKGRKQSVARIMDEMELGGEILRVRAGDQERFTLPASLELLGRRLSRGKAKILSPFDNLVIQRKRMQALFDFDYLIECYVPAAKRQYGYFALPVLWDGRLVARMDCKVERKKSVLNIHHLALEPWLVKPDAFLTALEGELAAFMRFNRCDRLVVHRTSPSNIRGSVGWGAEITELDCPS
ncbi:MAG: crosslink repair DNA glycosylase YcaQ family protein [Verrucomicrobiales bacterium]|nr:crosslink repair DNA glycosylase YcaQ family protein [Verrucomicrobiales bacterium]